MTELLCKVDKGVDTKTKTKREKKTKTNANANTKTSTTLGPQQRHRSDEVRSQFDDKLDGYNMLVWEEKMTETVV